MKRFRSSLVLTALTVLVATISIADSGCGMTQVFVRDRLFRPFDSTKGTQGMGIGASQVRDYAKMMGGQINVSSEPGSGSCFEILLPLNNDASERVAETNPLTSTG